MFVAYFRLGNYHLVSRWLLNAVETRNVLQTLGVFSCLLSLLYVHKTLLFHVICSCCIISPFLIRRLVLR